MSRKHEVRKKTFAAFAALKLHHSHFFLSKYPNFDKKNNLKHTTKNIKFSDSFVKFYDKS